MCRFYLTNKNDTFVINNSTFLWITNVLFGDVYGDYTGLVGHIITNTADILTAKLLNAMLPNIRLN